MVVFIAVPFGLVTLYFWLRGGWRTAAVLTVLFGAFLAVIDSGIGRALAGFNAMECLYLALIWAPFAVRQMRGRKPRVVVMPRRAVIGIELR